MMHPVRNYGGEAVGSVAHTFERAGLGVAPFRFIGVAERVHTVPGEMPRAGGSCDYCGTCIRVACIIRSADGRTFEVGSDCVAKTGDDGLRKIIDAKLAERRREQSHARDDAKISAAVAALPRARVALTAKPHPDNWHAANGKTLADWCEFMLTRAGRAGGVKAAKVVMAEVQSE